MVCPLWVGQNRKSSMRAYVFRFAPESGHRAMQSACPFRAISGSQLISITSSGHSSLPKHLGFISKRPARCSSSHNMAPIAFLGACFWVDGQKQTYPNQYLKVVLLSGGLHERALGLRILA